METKPNGEMPIQPEQETKEPTLEEWVKVYTEIWKEAGREVDTQTILQRAQELQAEMNEGDKKELTMLVYIPEGVTTKDAWDIVKKDSAAFQHLDPEKITAEEEIDKSIVCFARFSQEADMLSESVLRDTPKSAEEWEKAGVKSVVMTPRIGMISRVAYHRITGKQMDTKISTMFPGSRSDTGKVPIIKFDSQKNEVLLRHDFPGIESKDMDIRRVVSKKF